MDPVIIEFWKYIADNLQYLQNTKNSVSEIINNNLEEFSHETNVLLAANDLLHKINPLLVLLFNTKYIQLPELAAKRVIEYKKEEKNVHQENYTPIPVIIRFELILSTCDPLLLPKIEELYQCYKVLNNKKEISILPDWIITKFRQPKQVIYSLDNCNFILQKANKENEIDINNPVELIVFIEDSDIDQEKLDKLKQEILLYIDACIGEYRSYKYITNFTILPLSYYPNVKDKFPEHYILQDWSELYNTIQNIIPQPHKCINCNISEDNIDMIKIIEQPNELIEVGNYCTYCFKIITKIINLK